MPLGSVAALDDCTKAILLADHSAAIGDQIIGVGISAELTAHRRVSGSIFEIHISGRCGKTSVLIFTNSKGSLAICAANNFVNTRQVYMGEVHSV